MGESYDGAVAERDSAFLWETEALRAATKQVMPPTRHLKVAEPSDWLTLRQANEITGVPVPTLRKWALGQNVPSYLEKTALGQLRMISLQGVYQRAEELGRRVETRPVTTPIPGEAPAPSTVDLTRVTETTTASSPQVPEGTMLVPLDAWNKILNQLGNLHEAGQQLAEARERAAKAETQAVFLKERLAELRAELAEARDASVPSDRTGEAIETEAPSEPVTASSTGSGMHGLATYAIEMRRQLLARWKGRRGR
jgi:hypothetical protein